MEGQKINRVRASVYVPESMNDVITEVVQRLGYVGVTDQEGTDPVGIYVVPVSWISEPRANSFHVNMLLRTHRKLIIGWEGKLVFLSEQAARVYLERVSKACTEAM